MSRMLNEASFWNMSLVSAQCDQSICFKKLNREGLDQSEHTCGLALVFKMRTWIKVFFFMRCGLSDMFFTEILSAT